MKENVMDYDFAGLCADQQFKLEKRLQSINKSFVKEYQLALNVINNAKANDARGELMVQVEDCLRDVVSKNIIFYVEAMNKIQNILGKYL